MYNYAHYILDENMTQITGTNNKSINEWIYRGRIPYLDGFRAIAILSVIFYHIGGQYHYYILDRIFDGQLGVTLFFVISGFLITLLLLREHDRNNQISIVDFYKRRFLRIFPAYYSYLIIMCGLYFMHVINFPYFYWIGAFTYSICYFPDIPRAWFLAHTWSLAVEEHFYLLWPIIILIFTPKKAYKILIGFLILTPIIRIFVLHITHSTISVQFYSITQMGSIAIGCLLAFCVYSPSFANIKDVLVKYPKIILSSGILILFLSKLVHTFNHGLLLHIFHNSLIVKDIASIYIVGFYDPVNAFGFALIISGCLFLHSAILNKLLNNKVIVHIGVLSYSLYLWQQPFTYSNSFLMKFHWFILLFVIYIVALCSYKFIETPFLKIKEKQSSSNTILNR